MSFISSSLSTSGLYGVLVAKPPKTIIKISINCRCPAIAGQQPENPGADLVTIEPVQPAKASHSAGSTFDPDAFEVETVASRTSAKHLRLVLGGRGSVKTLVE
jgi:hypothetical protein